MIAANTEGGCYTAVGILPDPAVCPSFEDVTGTSCQSFVAVPEGLIHFKTNGDDDNLLTKND